MIAGFDAAVTGLEVGSTRTQRVPPEQAYGALPILCKLIHWRSVNSSAHPFTSGLSRPTPRLFCGGCTVNTGDCHVMLSIGHLQASTIQRR